MAKKKAELLEEAKALGLDVKASNTVAEITQAIESKSDDTPAKEESKAGEASTGETESKFTKAGKHSKRAVEEAEAEEARQERKEQIAAGEIVEEEVKRGPAPKVRPVIERRGKKYRKAAESIDQANKYDLAEAVKLAKEASYVNFDASVELHLNLNIDPKYADQNIRGSLVLPHGSGKTVRIAVFADDEGVKQAKSAGADNAYGDEFLDKLKKEDIDFDILISTPQNMAKLGKYARILGPKGLMPNPKSGTVTTDITKAVTEAKGGRIEYRVDKSGIVHLIVGKVSFSDADVVANIETVLKAIKDARPPSVKNEYVSSATVTTSMGPGVRFNYS